MARKEKVLDIDPPPPEVKEWASIITYAVRLFGNLLSLFRKS